VTLKGQAALVTGASRGLGLAISRALAAENVRVALLARAGAELDDAAKQVAAVSEAIAVRADVTEGSRGRSRHRGSRPATSVASTSSS
jgi:NAD(P)-dependent dehydrogenase (short-subunit alcohol dehydrogenase family)